MRFALITFGNEESYGLLFVGGELLELGQEIRFFDAEMEEIVELVVKWNPDFIMFSPMTVFYSRALQVSCCIRKELPYAVSVFGGHHAMASPEICNSEYVDVVVVGPVRGSILQIMGGKRGVIYTSLTSPEDMAMPAREQYFADIPRIGNRYRKVMLSMLGCPYNCSYCSSSTGHMSELFGKKNHRRYYLSRRPISVLLDEAKEILRYETSEIEWTDDDIFAGKNSEKWLSDFLDAWVKHIGLPMYVSTTSISALKVPSKVLQKLKKVVNVIGMGVQAIRPESLRLFNRSWDNEKKMKSAYDRLRSFGFKVNLQAIVGLPVENPVEDALDTVKAMQRIGSGSICSVYPLMIYPGTTIEKYCEENDIPLNDDCGGDTNSAIPRISFTPTTVKQLRNICKLGTLFVKYNVGERWMRALINLDFDETTSQQLSMVRYHDCVVDRLEEKGEELFEQIITGMNLRY